MGLFCKKKKSPEIVFKDNILAATAKLNQVSDLCPDFGMKCAISNTVMLMKGMADRFTNYSVKDLEEIFGFVDKLIGDITTASVGISSFNGSKIESKAFTKSISAYVSLLAFYMTGNLASGRKTLSISEADKHRKAIADRQNNEALELRAAEYEKKIAEQDNEKAAKSERMEEILDRVRSGECSASEEQSLKREYSFLKQGIEAIKQQLDKMVHTLKSIRDQITDNEMYDRILSETDSINEVISRRSYSSVEEFCRAIEAYNTTVEIFDTEHTTVSDLYSSSSAKEETVDDEFANASREGAANRKKNQNKAQDDEFFSFDNETKNAN